jgi:phosphoribosylamine--glycine ligase
MRKQGIIYKGVMYAGLMLCANGPQVLEFNCRFGDPEAQVILPLLKTDLIEVMTACVEGRLHEVPVKWNRNLVAATVVMVDEDYPGSPEANNGGHIHGLDAVEEGVIVFHYGTTRVECHNKTSYVVVGGGGRRLSITAIGKSYEEVFLKIYCSIGCKGLTFPGAAWRSDIGQRRDLPKWLVPIYC